MRTIIQSAGNHTWLRFAPKLRGDFVLKVAGSIHPRHQRYFAFRKLIGSAQLPSTEIHSPLVQFVMSKSPSQSLIFLGCFLFHTSEGGLLEYSVYLVEENEELANVSGDCAISHPSREGEHSTVCPLGQGRILSK